MSVYILFSWDRNVGFTPYSVFAVYEDEDEAAYFADLNELKGYETMIVKRDFVFGKEQ